MTYVFIQQIFTNLLLCAIATNEVRKKKMAWHADRAYKIVGKTDVNEISESIVPDLASRSKNCLNSNRPEAKKKSENDLYKEGCKEL